MSDTPVELLVTLLFTLRRQLRTADTISCQIQKTYMKYKYKIRMKKKKTKDKYKRQIQKTNTKDKYKIKIKNTNMKDK